MTAPSGVPVRDDPELHGSLQRWEAAGVVVFLVLVIAFPVYKVVEGPRRDRALAAREKALVTTGRQLWALNCSSCHGDRGEGIDAPALNSQQFLQSTKDDQIHRIVAAGITGTEMPAWWNEFGGPLTDDEIAAVVAFVRSWERTAPSRPDWRNPQGSGQASPGGG